MTRTRKSWAQWRDGGKVSRLQCAQGARICGEEVGVQGGFFIRLADNHMLVQSEDGSVRELNLIFGWVGYRATLSGEGPRAKPT
jgi:hypothetical protein